MAQELEPIILKFPAFQAKIIQLYNNDANFRSLCDDYWLASRCRQNHGGKEEGNRMLATEFGLMCELLEREMTDYLMKH